MCTPLKSPFPNPGSPLFSHLRCARDGPGKVSAQRSIGVADTRPQRAHPVPDWISPCCKAIVTELCNETETKPGTTLRGNALLCKWYAQLITGRRMRSIAGQWYLPARNGFRTGKSVKEEASGKERNPASRSRVGKVVGENARGFVPSGNPRITLVHNRAKMGQKRKTT